MALRVRLNGDIVCAAINEQEIGDLYFDDTAHHILCSKKVIVTEAEPTHSNSGGQWWLKGLEPGNIKIDSYWYEERR